MPANPDPRTLPLYARLLAWIIAWRVELGAAIAVTAGRVMLARATDAATADYAMVVTIAAILSVRWTRWWLKDKLVGARRRRRWEQGLAWMWPAPVTPRLHAHGTGPWGEWAQVRTGPGGTVADLAARADALAAWLGVIEVRVHPSATSAGWATLHALVADPLARPAGPWPWANAASTSLWQPVPVGIDEAGAPVAIGLFEHNLLLGGEPGAGKSVALSQLVAAAALDPGASLWLLDGKLVELAAWKPCAAGSAGLDVSDATAVLRAVQTIMDSRYQGLLASGQRKVAAGTGIHVVVVDELAHYLTWPD
ncbi:MAG TPA: FtsK/SpoIIIE domain-containing protein, partial [Acidimicrobiales bacterium]|nr:FtsK/SpoIIIE domain-containing protein [Acidimicrobiales bacterium]